MTTDPAGRRPTMEDVATEPACPGRWSPSCSETFPAPARRRANGVQPQQKSATAPITAPGCSADGRRDCSA